MNATVTEVLREVPTELIIGGEHRAASDNATFEVIDPATGDALATVASGSVEDAIACVDAASTAARTGQRPHRGNAPRSCNGPTS